MMGTDAFVNSRFKALVALVLVSFSSPTTGISCQCKNGTAGFAGRLPAHTLRNIILFQTLRLEVDEGVGRGSGLDGEDGSSLGGAAIKEVLGILLEGARGSAGESGLIERGAGNGGGGRGSSTDGVGLGGDRAAADQTLGLGGVVSHILLGELGDVRSVLVSGITDLGGLGVDKVGGMLELGINDFLVRGVEEGDHESSSGAENSETPVRDNLDEVVGQKGSDEGLLFIDSQHPDND